MDTISTTKNVMELFDFFFERNNAEGQAKMVMKELENFLSGEKNNAPFKILTELKMYVSSNSQEVLLSASINENIVKGPERLVKSINKMIDDLDESSYFESLDRGAYYKTLFRCTYNHGTITFSRHE